MPPQKVSNRHCAGIYCRQISYGSTRLLKERLINHPDRTTSSSLIRTTTPIAMYGRVSALISVIFGLYSFNALQEFLFNSRRNASSPTKKYKMMPSSEPYFPLSFC